MGANRGCAPLALLTGAVACGRFGFAPVGDPSGDGGASGDSALTFDILISPGCSAWTPWQMATQVAELDGPFDEGDPAIRFDGLEIVFSRTLSAAGNEELFHARRTALDVPFGTAVALT